MATNFPTSFDTAVNNLKNPTASTQLSDTNGLAHSGLHVNVNDALRALETKVGVNGSADVNSLDYKVTNSAISAVPFRTTMLGSDEIAEVNLDGNWVKIIAEGDAYKELTALAGAALSAGIRTALAFDSIGNLYWAVVSYEETGGNTNLKAYVFKITPNGVVTIVDTQDPTYGAHGTALAIDSNNNLYWAISNHRNNLNFTQTSYVYKITPAGIKTTFASQATIGATGTALIFDPADNLFWAISNHRDGAANFTQTSYVYKITPAGVKTTFASQATIGAYGTDLIFDTAGNLYWAICNYYNSVDYYRTSYVYKITPAGTLTTFASQATIGANGTALTFDTTGNLYWAVCNYYNGTNHINTNYVYKITSAGTLTTFAQTNINGATDTSLIFDSKGNLYWGIVGYGNGMNFNQTGYVHKITPTGARTTFTSIETTGAWGTDIIFDSNENLYWAICNSFDGSTTKLNSYVYLKQKI